MFHITILLKENIYTVFGLVTVIPSSASSFEFFSRLLLLPFRHLLCDIFGRKVMKRKGVNSVSSSIAKPGVTSQRQRDLRFTV